MAGQDFEKLLASIQKVNAEMKTLIANINKARAELAQAESPAQRQAIGRRIGGYQTALSNKAEQSTGLAAQSISNIRESKGQGKLQISSADVERRMNLITVGVPLTNAEIDAKGREAATRVLNQQKEFDRQLLQSRAGGASTIGHPAGVTPPPTVVPGVGIPDPFAGTDTKDSAAAKRKAEEEKLLQTLRGRVQSEQKYAQALDQAIRQGFTINDLRRVQSQSVGGPEKLQFEKRDATTGGIEQRFDTMVSPGGRSTPTISNQFRTFGQGVIRDIGELTKWSIALAAVYGPMKKLQELTQIMIENQTKLAEASIAAGSSFLSQAKIFDTAADAANRAGEEITGVIDAFTLAYRAAGGGANEIERYGTASKLLADSLTLSKLSSLDQATAIDTLAAALRQSSGGLDQNNNALEQGTTLLDKWVRVTKVANVDLATLATGFAVVGDSAEAAGLDIDQLNGLLAAIAETGIGSGKESANVAKRLVGLFQSDQAVEALNNLGIASKNTEGEMRPLLDIITEIYTLREQGAISDTQFSSLTRDIGQGPRGQSNVASLLENADRIFEVADQSRKASGDAEAALAKQLETVQTSLTRLNNAFEELAQTMGTEGGFLGIIQSSIEGVTVLVKVFDSLVSLLGKATPAMAAFIATSLVLKNRGLGSLQQGVAGLAQRVQTPAGFVGGQYEGPNQLPTRTQSFVGRNILGTNAPSVLAQGIGVSLIPALQNYFNKDDRYGKTKAGADIAGGVGGAIIGTLTGAGPIVGAAIGTAISEAFVSATIARKVDLFGFGKTPGLATDSTAIKTEEDKNKQLETAVSGLYESIGGGSEGIGKFLSSTAENQSKFLVDEINKAIKNGDTEKAIKIFSRASSNVTQPEGVGARALEAAGITKEFIAEAASQGKQIEFSPERIAYNNASAEAKKAYDIALAERNATEAGPNISTAFSQKVGANRELFAPLVSSIAAGMREQISNERISGDLKGTAYKSQIESVGGLDTKALQYYTAFGKEFEKINGGIKDSTELFKAFADITVYGSAEAVNELTAITGEISAIINALNDPALKGKDTIDIAGLGTFTRAELEGKLAESQDLAANLAKDTYQQAALSRLNIPNVQGDVTKPLTTDEFANVKQTAIGLQEQFYKGFLDIPDQLYEGLKESWDEWAQIIEESGETFFETVEGIDPQFFQQAMQKLMEENKLKSQKSDPYGIQQIDLPGSKAGELQGMVNYFSGYLAQNFPKYEQKPEELGVIFNDYVTGTLHGDNLAIKLALEKLVDINQKQLDGQYNIPEGATFWVPLTAAYYRNKGAGESGAGLPDVADTAVTGNTSATEQNTRAITELSRVFGLRNQENDKFQIKNNLGGTGSDTKLTGSQVRSETMRDKMLGLDTKEAQGYVYGTGTGTGKDYKVESPSETGGASFIETIMQKLTMALLGLQGGVGLGIGAGSTQRPMTLSATASGQAAPAQVTNKLDLKVQSTTNLTLDGRVLATSLQNYLATDLIRTEGTQGTITKKYVI